MMCGRGGVAPFVSVALAVLLVGCSSGDNTGGGSGGSASGETTTTATESVPADEYVPASADGPAQNVPRPVKPPLADEESVEGAQAFLDYLSDTWAYAQETGDTSLAREVTAEECGSCVRHFDNLDSHYKAGGWASRGHEKFTILSDDLPVDSYGLYAPEASIDSSTMTIWNPDGEVIQERLGEHGDEERILVHIDYRDGKWTYVTTAPLGSQ